MTQQSQRFLKNLLWLSEIEAFDKKGEKTLKDLLKKKKKFLIIGNEHSGSRSFGDAVANELHQLKKEPVVFPSLVEKNIGQLIQSPKWKKIQTLMNHNFPSVLVVGHHGENPRDNGDEYFEKLAKKFDVVLDVRRLPTGKRALFQILVKRGEQLKPVYCDPLAEKWTAKTAA